jgi:hypothetical protein
MENSFLTNVADQFDIKGPIMRIRPFGTGHINDTFLIETVEPQDPDYLLQRKNHYVFKDVPGMMENIKRVTTHIKNKLEQEGNHDVEREVMTVISTKKGDLYWNDEEGNFWSVFLFIKDSCSFDLVSDARMAYEGGVAFGRFQRLLDDIPPPPLHDTIPEFHNMELRFQRFHRVVEADEFGRKAIAREEISFALEREKQMTEYFWTLRNEMPLRITHNDTKFNNVLFDKAGKALCVIDLDTVMPGFIHYDFGDSIRTAANHGEEDDAQLDRVKLNMDVFTAFSKGFLSETSKVLSSDEIGHLAYAGHYMTFIMGLRFLTDFIEGDVYYKTAHPEHNIQRSRAQFALVRSMEAHYPEMKAVIADICRI